MVETEPGMQGRHRQQRDQAGEDGNRPGGAGARVHHRGRKDSREHGGRHLPGTRVRVSQASRFIAATRISSSALNTVLKSKIRRPSSMRATDGRIARAQLAFGCHGVGTVHARSATWGWTARESHRRRSPIRRGSLRRAGPAGARRAQARARISPRTGAAWRERARRPSAPSSTLRSVFSKRLVDHLVEAEGAEQGIAAQPRDELVRARRECRPAVRRGVCRR